MEAVETTEAIVVSDLMNSEFQLRAHPEPQEVPTEAVKRWPAKFAKDEKDAAKKAKALAEAKDNAIKSTGASAAGAKANSAKAKAERAQAAADAEAAKAAEADAEAPDANEEA